MPPVAIYTEEELLLLLKTQSREGFNYLYKNYASVLYGCIHKIVYDEETANDVLQETFVKIWNNISMYDASKGRIYTWMINIARNSAIDKLRSKGEIMKSKMLTGDDAVNSSHASLTSEQATDTIGLKKMVAGLRPEYSIIVSLAYFRGYTLDEISSILNIPLGTVKTRMRSAIKQLRDTFNRY